MKETKGRVGRLRMVLVVGAAGITAAGCAATPTHHTAAPKSPRHSTGPATLGNQATTTTASTSLPTTEPPPTTTEPLAPTTTAAPPATASVAGSVTAVGDSVMLDYQTPLQTDIPGIDVEAAVSRQWGAGEELLSQLKAEGRLGTNVIVALGTNGPISATDFSDMMTVLQGAARVVFVNIHVDRPWQDPNNAVLAQGAADYPNVRIADWASLAARNPEWFGSDGTHLAIDGPGAQALASLITNTLSAG